MNACEERSFSFPSQMNVGCLATIVARSVFAKYFQRKSFWYRFILTCSFSKTRKVNAVPFHLVSIVQERVEDILPFHLTTMHMDL